MGFLGDTSLYFGLSPIATGGISYSNQGGLSIPVGGGLNLTGLSASETCLPFINKCQKVTAHIDWNIIEYHRLLGSGANRLTSSYVASISMSDWLQFGSRVGLSGEWGPIRGSGEGGYVGIGEPSDDGSSSGSYWALAFTAGLHIDIVPFSPRSPLAFYTEILGHIGGGKANGDGAFFIGGTALLGLQAVFY